MRFERILTEQNRMVRFGKPDKKVEELTKFPAQIREFRSKADSMMEKQGHFRII